jgi:hypothetical protein
MIANYLTIRAMPGIALMSAVIFGLSLGANADEKHRTSQRAQTSQPGMERQPEQATKPGAGHPFTLSATLADRDKNAQEQTATVEVKVAGIQLIDAAAVNEQPQQGQGHLHYQVDNGPLIATTVTKLSFHELSSGEHKITVMLMGNDHQPLGVQETLTVTIPTGRSGRAQRQ